MLRTAAYRIGCDSCWRRPFLWYRVCDSATGRLALHCATRSRFVSPRVRTAFNFDHSASGHRKLQLDSESYLTGDCGDSATSYGDKRRSRGCTLAPRLISDVWKPPSFAPTPNVRLPHEHWSRGYRHSGCVAMTISTEIRDPHPRSGTRDPREARQVGQRCRAATGPAQAAKHIRTGSGPESRQASTCFADKFVCANRDSHANSRTVLRFLLATHRTTKDSPQQCHPRNKDRRSCSPESPDL